MLSKLNRIKKKKDFDVIFKKGASLKSDLLILKVLKNNFEQSRFGFVVSKKVSKKATVRNKLKRRLSEAVKTELKNIKDGLDLVFISLPGIEKKEFPDIKKSVNNILARAKILKN